MKITPVLVFAACIAAPLVTACADTLPGQDLRIVDAQPVERLSAALLWRDFQTQRDEAERVYNGRAVIVTGEVTRAGTDDEGLPYVYFAQTDTGGLRAGLLEEQAADVIAAVQEQPRVSLKCFCEGTDGKDVVLKSCIPEP